MNKFAENYQRLNAEQKKAVDKIYGPVLVLAGPGTGKTQVIALRIANILQKTDVNPFNILCLTFTNAGVKAMRDRLVKIMGVDGYKVVIHTFHSFCGEVMAMYPERFLFAKRTTQISDLQKINIGQEIIDNLENIKYTRPLKSPYFFLPDMMKNVSALKREGLSPDDFATLVKKVYEEFLTHDEYYHAKGKHAGKMIGKYANKQKKIEKNQELALFYKAYQERLRENGWFDFDDMILSVLAEFKRDRSFLADFQERYMFVLVDEYQDTNGAQNKLLEFLAWENDQPNVFAVGDNDQSIYRFQGASLSNMLFFRDIFPGAEIVVLKNCYRCSEMIMNGAREMMQNTQEKIENYLQVKKDYIAQNKSEKKIMLAEFENDQVELFFLAEEIKRLIVDQKVLPENIAVFFRNNFDMYEVADVLKRYGIDCRLAAGEDVLASLDVKKVVKILGLLDGIKDNALLFEIMQFDFWELDAVDVMSLFYENRREKFIWLWLQKNYAENQWRQPMSMANFVQVIQEMMNDRENSTFVQMIEKVIKNSGLLAKVAKSSDKFERLMNIKTFFDFVKESSHRDTSYDWRQLTVDMREMTENGIKIVRNELEFDGQAVNLMTAHGSKGLEFDYVFVYKCIDKYWSNARDNSKLSVIEEVIANEDAEDKLEEERRLFYVAMTRAKSGLYLGWSKSYGAGEAKKETSKAMFVEEIGDRWTETIDTAKYHQQTEKWLDNYFGIVANKEELPLVSREYVAKILADYTLSPTGLNKYLKCPRQFFYEDVLRVPKAKSAILSFGTAVHSALENFYIDLKKSGEVPAKETLCQYYEKALTKEVMTDKERRKYEQQGKEYLIDYYDFYHDSFRQPIFNEFSFSRGNLMLDQKARLTGKVDRVELLEDSDSRVRVVDYKTTKPKSVNQIKGQTKGGDGNYYRQLVFYKLLGELAGYFPYEIVETELDFVIPNDKGVFKKERFAITSQEVNELQELILRVWDDIQNQRFGCSQDASNCKNHNRKCEFWDLCHGDD